MEWQLALVIIIGGLLFLMATGMPVVFCFLVVNAIGMYFWWGGGPGLEQLVLGMQKSVTTFHLLPVPLFILMGELMFHTGIAPKMIDTLDKWLGRIPGRLGLLAVGGGVLFATLSGSSMSSTAMLGSVLTPEMEKRGYKKPMSLGPILGSGGLAMMIPPSGLGVLLGAIGEISIGKILIAIILPGLLMAVLYTAYIVLRCLLQPQIAPAYTVARHSLRERLLDTAKYILPLGFIVFLVTGVILLGIATPTEAAATGTTGCIILAVAYKRLTWKVMRESVYRTLEISAMVLLLISASAAYSQNLAYTGVSRGLAEFILNLPVPPISIIIGMQIILLFLGMFMAIPAIMMITLPMFVPVVIAMGFSEIWFAVIFLLAMEMGATSPPFGLGLFVMKGVAPPDTTMEDCYKAALPFLGCDLIAMILLIAFPQIAIWLLGFMR